MNAEDLDWVRTHVLPPMRRDALTELRSCACQMRPTFFPNVPPHPEGHVWDTTGRTVAYPDRRAVVEIWLADRTCQWGAALPTTERTTQP